MAWKSASFGGRLEEREFRAGEGEPMRQRAGEFVARERGHVVADDDALGGRLMDRHGQAAAQFRVAEQQETEAVLGASAGRDHRHTMRAAPSRPSRSETRVPRYTWPIARAQRREDFVETDERTGGQWPDRPW